MVFLVAFLFCVCGGEGSGHEALLAECLLTPHKALSLIRYSVNWG